MDEELLTFRSRAVSLVAVFVCESYTELCAGEWVNFGEWEWRNRNSWSVKKKKKSNRDAANWTF